MMYEFLLLSLYLLRGGPKRGRGGGSIFILGETGRIEGVAAEGGYFGSIVLFGYIREGRALM